MPIAKHKLIEDLKISSSAVELRAAVEQAIKDESITREEYDEIITIAVRDGYVDAHEEIILKEFHQLIYDRDIKFKKS